MRAIRSGMTVAFFDIRAASTGNAGAPCEITGTGATSLHLEGMGLPLQVTRLPQKQQRRPRRLR
jgi:hypothetical protein